MIFRPASAILILLASAAWGQQFTPEQEVALGELMAAEFLKQSTPLESKAIQAFVDHTGSRLAAHAETPFRFHFVVIAGYAGGPTYEPRSFPGGYILIPAQLFLACRDNAEFAGMLAHAMAHVVNRDATRAATTDTGNGLVPLLPNFPGDDMFAPAAFRTQRRQYEEEADATAVRMMRDVGYDPAALRRYKERAASLEAPARNPPSGPSVTEFHNIQDRIRPLTPPPYSNPPTLFRPGKSPQ
jgi:predicted Zn-dependent protease